MVSLAVAVAYNLQCSTLVVEKILGMKNGRAQWSIVLSYKGWQKVVPLKVFTRFFSVVNKQFQNRELSKLILAGPQ